MLEYQKIRIFFAEGYTLNWSEDGFMIQEVKKYCAADICY